MYRPVNEPPCEVQITSPVPDSMLQNQCSHFTFTWQMKQKVSGDWKVKTTTLRQSFYVDGLRPDLCLWVLRILRVQRADPPRGQCCRMTDSPGHQPTAYAPSPHCWRAWPVTQTFIYSEKRSRCKRRHSRMVTGDLFPSMQSRRASSRRG